MPSIAGIRTGRPVNYESSLPESPLPAHLLPTSPTDLHTFSSAGVRVLALNRKPALNALSLSLVKKLYNRLQFLQHNAEDAYAVILTTTHSRAFCAGGDVKSLHRRGKNEKDTHLFFGQEYQLNLLTSKLRIPFIPYMDGLTMGGGAGLTMHSAIRVVSENTVWAMPEAEIGFFTDVGATHFLPQLRGEFGTFLALTATRLYGYDNVYAGIGTHFMPRPEFAFFLETLSQSVGNTSEAVLAYLDAAHAEAQPAAGWPKFSFEPHLATIERCFSKNTVEEILEALKAEGTDFAQEAIRRMNKMSPTSLKVTLALLRKHASVTLEEALQQEYRVAANFMNGTDFFEGVDAMLIRRDREPRWQPSSLRDVTDSAVAKMLEKPAHLPDLTFDKMSVTGAAAAGATTSDATRLLEETAAELQSRGGGGGGGGRSMADIRAKQQHQPPQQP